MTRRKDGEEGKEGEREGGEEEGEEEGGPADKVAESWYS
jgi:hypothetical protein